METMTNILVKMLLFTLRGLHSFSMNDAYTGDIEEEYHYRIETSGGFSALFWLLIQTIKSIPISIYYNFYFGGTMFKNYFLTALRNMKRQKGFTLINLIGLTTGLTCCLLIFFYINFEYSFDNYHTNADRIYRVDNYIKMGANEMRGASTPRQFAQALMDDFPEVETATKFYEDQKLIKYKNEIIKESIVVADENYFKIFTLDLIDGDKHSALSMPYSVVISRKTAKKLFGTENPMGKIITFDNETQYTVTGLFDKVPENSDYRFDILTSMPPLSPTNNETWLSYSYRTFFILKENVDYKTFESKLDFIVEKYIAPELEKVFGQKFEDFKKSGNDGKFFLQPMADLHMFSETSGLDASKAVQNRLLIIASIGLFILILACINYINLSTSQSLMRSKEIGVRKVLGSLRKQLITQFLTESLFLTIIALIIAIGFVELLLPQFNVLIESNVITDYSNLPFVLTVVSIILFVGVLSGLYPSMLMSGLRPVQILTDKINKKSSRGFIRKGLVIFQFITSISLISGTLIVDSQLKFINSKDLGYKTDQVIVLNGTSYLGKNAKTFKNELLKSPEISNVTITGFLPVTSSSRQTMTFLDGNTSKENAHTINSWNIDCDYLNTMGIELIKGRNFSKDYSTDSNSVIINQALAKKYGWKNPLEHTIGQPVNLAPLRIKDHKVIGVVKDFHYRSLKENIAPLVMYLGDNNYKISVKFNAANVSNVLSLLKSKWKEFNTGHPFSYSFMSESFERMYNEEVRTGKVFGIFSFLAILIACLGLFGLSAYTAQRKKKEIGIRKVHGAELKDIVILLTKEFVLFVIIALIISVPISYYFMDKWLMDFAYRTVISSWIFILSGIIALAIAIFTVSYHAIKSGSINPAKTLKYE